MNLKKAKGVASAIASTWVSVETLMQALRSMSSWEDDPDKGMDRLRAAGHLKTKCKPGVTLVKYDSSGRPAPRKKSIEGADVIALRYCLHWVHWNDARAHLVKHGLSLAQAGSLLGRLVKARRLDRKPSAPGVVELRTREQL